MLICVYVGGGGGGGGISSVGNIHVVHFSLLSFVILNKFASFNDFVPQTI